MILKPQYNSKLFIAIQSSPSTAPLFVHCHSWRNVQGGGKPKCSVVVISVLKLSPTVRNDGAISRFYRILYAAPRTFGMTVDRTDCILFYKVLESYQTLGWCSDQGATLLVGRSRDRSPVVSQGIFSEASDKSMCPGSTEPLKMSTRIFLGRCVGVTTLPPSCAECLEIWEP
jgi:hypothetical protein